MKIRIRFSICDLFWITLAVALLCGRWVDRDQWRKKQIQTLTEARQLALENWRRVRADELAKVGAFAGEWESEAKARELYFECRAQLQQAELASPNPLTAFFK
jgi:hypothetical protein